MKKNKIVLTGGGTTGHVSVNLALIPILREEGWDIHYMGSKNGIEKELVSNLEGVTYHFISTGKLRRYLSFENFKDIFKIILGSFQASWKIFKIKPSVTFSKGGFVTVPVLFASWLNRVPSIAHESDLTPGLANKLVQPFVKKIFTTFPDTTKYIKSGKGEFLGPVIREDLKNGDKKKAKDWLGIKDEKPVLLAMGGSLGANFINDTIRENIEFLLKHFNVIHSCGKDGRDPNFNREGYYQFEYIKEELKDILALSDIVISRAGSNAIFEFLYYKKPMVLIPLPKSRSRGDQFDNAKSFERQGFAEVVDEDLDTSEKIIEKIITVHANHSIYIDKMKNFEFDDTVSKIYKTLLEIKK